MNYKKTSIQELIEDNITNGLGFQNNYNRIKSEVSTDFVRIHIAANILKSSDDYEEIKKADDAIQTNPTIDNIALALMRVESEEPLRINFKDILNKN